MITILSVAQGRKRELLTSVAFLLGFFVASTSAVADLINISTRAYVEGGDRVAIGGFVIRAPENAAPDYTQCVVVRARGQSIGISSGKLSDPNITLLSGTTVLDANDNWGEHQYAKALEDLGLEPGDPTDAALYTCLSPGPYTAVLRNATNENGIGIVEVVAAEEYDLSSILGVSLASDRGSALAGDLLDFVGAPQLGGTSTYSETTNTLTVATPSAMTAAQWIDFLEVGLWYRVRGNASGLTSDISFKSGPDILHTVTANGGFDFLVEGSPGTNLAVISNGASNSATVSLEVRDVANLTYKVTNAVSCIESGDTPEWVNFSVPLDGTGAAEGTFPVTIDVETTQTLDFGLTCLDSTQGQISRSVKLEANLCPGAGAVNITKWTDLLFSAGAGFEWPRPSGNYSVINIDKNTTLAIQFNTDTAEIDDFYGKIANPEFGGEPGVRDISISRCPGQYADLPSQCLKTGVGSSGAIYWELDNQQGASHTCKLDRGVDGATYYFNVRFPYGCGNNSCRTRVQP